MKGQTTWVTDPGGDDPDPTLGDKTGPENNSLIIFSCNFRYFITTLVNNYFKESLTVC